MRAASVCSIMFISLTSCLSPFLQSVLYYGISHCTCAKCPQNGSKAASPDKNLRQLCTFGYFHNVRKLLFICSYGHLTDIDDIFLHSAECQIPQYPPKAVHYIFFFSLFFFPFSLPFTCPGVRTGMWNKCRM